MTLMAATAFAASDQLSKKQIREFFVTADVVARKPIGFGVTGAWRVTLSDGTVTHDAAFQPVDATHQRAGGDDNPGADSFRHNIAAYRLAELVGLLDMMPVTVVRTLCGVPLGRSAGGLTTFGTMSRRGSKRNGGRLISTRGESKSIGCGYLPSWYTTLTDTEATSCIREVGSST